MDGFCRFLSDGNEKTPQGRAIGEAMKQGASDYLLKPFSMDLLERVIANLKEGRDSGPGAVPVTGSPEPRPILTQDPGMVRLLGTSESIASSSTPGTIEATAGMMTTIMSGDT